MADFEAALATFQEILDYRFRNLALLAQALGAWNLPLSPGAAAARQRLEFLGDAAWDFAVAAAAFHVWPHATAGDLTRLRAAWCSGTGLAHLARRLGLPVPPAPDGQAAPTPIGRALAEMPAARRRSEGKQAPVRSSDRVLAEMPAARSRSEEKLASTRPSDRVLAEMFEAVLGAVVEDGGLDAVKALALRVVAHAATAAAPPAVDPKSRLQMLAQARFGTLPTYRLLERRGPPHRPVFRVQARVSNGEIDIQVEAEGGSRRAAEQDAARLALERLVEAPEA